MGEIKHKWTGTVLTITSDSGTSSMDLKGEKGDDGPRGPQGASGTVTNEDGEIVVDLTGYATEAYVDKAVANIDTSNINLDDYYTKQQTETIVNEAVASIDTTKIDMSNYYTKAQTENLVESALDDVDLTDYPTNAELEAKGYQTADDVEGIVKEAVFDTVEITEVYVGETEPTDDYVRIWINPNGTPDQVATTSYVENAVEEAVGGIEDGAY